MDETKGSEEAGAKKAAASSPKFLSPVAKARALAKEKASRKEGDVIQEEEETIFKAPDDTRPSILVLGGCGMVGRNFVTFLVQNGLAKKIRVADKCIPAMGFFHPTTTEVFEAVDFVQADLTKPAHIDRTFATEAFDFVVNFAAETRYGQPQQIYDERCTNLSRLCAQKALQCGVRKFIEISTAQVYKSQCRKPSDESAAISPWTKVAAAKLAAEAEVTRVSGLYSLIIRPAFVYGPADSASIMPRIICAAAYVELGEKMKFLWDAAMKLNTVHVLDVCRGIWHLLSLDGWFTSPCTLSCLNDIPFYSRKLFL